MPVGQVDARATAHRRRSPGQIEESARNKSAILAAALEEFAAGGYTETSLESIARRVGLTRQGILHHFASKELLFVEVLNQQRRWADNQVEHVVETDAVSTLTELASFLGYSDQSTIHLSFIHVLEGEAIAGNTHAHGYAVERLARVREEITSRLERAREAGDLRQSVDVEAAALLIAAAINGLQTQRLLDPAINTRPAFDLILDLLIPGRAAGQKPVRRTFTTD